MATKLPLLIFPRPERTTPPKGSGGGKRPPAAESTEQRNLRIVEKFNQIKANFSDTPGNLEKILVIETVGKVLDFQHAVLSIPGLEWLGEFDVDYNDEDLFDYLGANVKELGEAKKASGRLYMSASTEGAADRLLALWRQWHKHKKLERGFGKWKEVFSHMRELREWNHEDMFRENGLLEKLKAELKENEPAQFEAELHFRKKEKDRSAVEKTIREEIALVKGNVLSRSCLEKAAFHALKIELPYAAISPFFGEKLPSIIRYLHPDLVKYCRPMAAFQYSPINDEDSETEERDFPPCDQNAPPVVGMLDGAPFLQHPYLDGRVTMTDPKEYSAQYTNLAEKKHGTATASLICHGDTNLSSSSSLPRKIYAQPVMIKDDPEKKEEHFPSKKFLEDIVVEAISHILQQPGLERVKIINISLGNKHVPFYHSVSSLARVFDSLAGEHGILFIISAGNQTEHEFSQSSRDSVNAEEIIRQVGNRQYEWKIISPAESINALTVGSLNKDEYDVPRHDKIDPLDKLTAAALYSRLGSGFRNQIKPDIIVAGGRFHYRRRGNDKDIYPVGIYKFQGLKHAVPGSTTIGASNVKSSPGTSYAAAITTHAAGEIYEVLESIVAKDQPRSFDEKYYPLLIKALLVHGASREKISGIYENTLKNRASQGRWKSYFSRFVGYGVPDFKRAKECAEFRVVSLGYGDILEKERHRYMLRLPQKCGDSSYIRLIATLAWFSPISTTHQRYRKAKLSFSINGGSPKRVEYDFQQVQNGTLQHEIFELENLSDLPENLSISVDCFPDATEHLDAPVAYGLAVTLEVAEGIDIYQAIKQANAAIIEA